jgi:hemerythrin-like domain-containing protein
MATRKRSKPTRSAPRDAIALLKEDHKRVQDLLEKLEGSSGRAKSREALLAKIEQEVKAHTQIEEEIFYPAYKEAVRSKEDRKLFFEAHEEHHVVDMFMGEFQNGELESESVTFAAKSKVLKDLIEHHIEEEEKQMFPKARKALGAEILRDLAERMEQRREEIMSGEGMAM